MTKGGSNLGPLDDEHVLIRRAVDALEEFARRFESHGVEERGDLGAFAKFFTDYAELLHHAKEEDVLLPALVEHGFDWDTGPVAHVRKDHNQERYLVRVLRQAAAQEGAFNEEDRRHAVAAIRGFIDFQRAHMDKEESILYPAARERLGAEDLEAILARLTQFDVEHAKTQNVSEMRRTIDELIERYAA